MTLSINMFPSWSLIIKAVYKYRKAGAYLRERQHTDGESQEGATAAGLSEGERTFLGESDQPDEDQ